MSGLDAGFEFAHITHLQLLTIRFRVANCRSLNRCMAGLSAPRDKSTRAPLRMLRFGWLSYDEFSNRYVIGEQPVALIR